jgi:hypothetical protein
MATGKHAGSKLPSNNANLARITGIDKFLTLPSQIIQAKKKPTRHLGRFGSALSREGRAAAAASEGSLAYGLAAAYSGGTAAEFHGLPRCPCLQIEN